LIGMHDPFESLIELTPQPTRVGLRGFGLGLALSCGWLGYHAAARFGHVAAGALASCAIMLALTACFRPLWLAPCHRAFAWLSFPVRWLFAWCALIVLFFGVLTPTAWIVRRLRKPPLPADGSAWLPARPRRGKAHYFEQS
jgi:hypothetical protein